MIGVSLARHFYAREGQRAKGVINWMSDGPNDISGGGNIGISVNGVSKGKGQVLCHPTEIQGSSVKLFRVK